MQTKIHCRKHKKYKTAKQRPDETTTARVTHNITSINNRAHAARRLTQPKRPIGEIVNIVKKQDI